MLYKNVTPSDIFKCQQCSECCKGYGGTFVTEKEIKAIADYLHIDSESFVDNYCQMSGGKPVLAQDKTSGQTPHVQRLAFYKKRTG